MLELFKEPLILSAIAVVVILRSIYKGYDGHTIEDQTKKKPFCIRGKPEIPTKGLMVNKKSCPKCGLESEKLQWTYFCSPQWTWQKLCGRSGFITTCPNCLIEVEVIETVIN